MRKDSLGDRMKGYENVSRSFLTRRMPTIIRLDGKAFHSFTKGFQRPFDDILIESMWETAKYLCENIQGCKVAYVQSDEISLLLTDYDSLDTHAWFDKNIQKIVSVSASMATMAFNMAFRDRALIKGVQIHRDRMLTAMFDSRVFVIPKEEVCNCFIWRQQDATRNSIQMLGQSKFSHKQLHQKNQNDIQEMLWQVHNINFNNLSTHLKRGACIVKELYNKDNTTRSRWVVDTEIPIFSQDRDYIERLVFGENKH